MAAEAERIVQGEAPVTQRFAPPSMKSRDDAAYHVAGGAVTNCGLYPAPNLVGRTSGSPLRHTVGVKIGDQRPR